MQKRIYMQPKMEIVKLKQSGIICTSEEPPKLQNESYDVVNESVTNDWF